MFLIYIFKLIRNQSGTDIRSAEPMGTWLRYNKSIINLI